MKTIIAICGLCMILATGAHAAGDPRKCDTTRVDKASYCAAAAADLAFRLYMTRIGHFTVIYSAPHTCSQRATNLTWACHFANGVGTVRFRALSNGWHTRVVLKCNDAATTPAKLCRA